MKQRAALLFLVVPMMSWANELPQPKAQAIKVVDSHATPAKPVEAKAVHDAGAKSVSKHAVPQPMAEPIKITKPSAPQAPAPEAHSAAPEVLKPTGQAVSRYVSPQFSSAKAATHRPAVRSKAPTASSRSYRANSVISYTTKPGVVRVLPASQIPSSAILPPSKQIQWSEPSNPMPSPKANIAWGAIEFEPLKAAQSSNEVVAAPVAGRKITSPKYYSETNSELRWQHYSYP